MREPEIRFLLDRTSRTFAVALPLLPPPTSHEASLAYLLFRVIDTIEDGPDWDIAAKAGALLAMEDHLDAPDPRRAEELAAGWLRPAPSPDRDSKDLIGAFPRLVAATLELPPRPQGLILGHAARTAAGMRRHLPVEPGAPIVLGNLDDLRGYCYAVAGIVGELLTELFLLRMPEAGPADRSGLRSGAARFGEALQLVNILRDERADILAGRRLVPAGLHDRAVRLAADDLAVARDYSARLRSAGAPAGVTRFTTFITTLADATLEAVVRDGPGARVGRDGVRRALREAHAAAGPDHETPLHV